MNLIEIYEKYKPYNLSDEEIIERYFIENHIEDKAIDLMNKLSQKSIKDLHRKVSYMLEWGSILRAILDNQIEEKDKYNLYSLVYTFTFYRDLNEKELEEVKQIFNKNDIKLCPVYFIAYLYKKGIWKKETYASWFNTLDLVLEIRGN